MGQEKRKWIMVEPSSEALNRDDDSTFLCELTSWYSVADKRSSGAYPVLDV